MEIASQMMPIILYMLLSILVIVAIVFLYKLTITLDKANTVLDDVFLKVKSLMVYLKLLIRVLIL